MNTASAVTNFEQFWRRLQRLGLNAYEARTYLVLIGHRRFKAQEVANRAGVPRQKVYEVLDNLVAKGFAEVVQEKTKLFSAVEPGMAIPNFLARKREFVERELTEQSRRAAEIVDDLNLAYTQGHQGCGTLEYLRIISEPGQSTAQFRELLAEVRQEYLEFSRPPYATTPLEPGLAVAAAERGVSCRVLVEADELDSVNPGLYEAAGAGNIELRSIGQLPMKLAVFDGVRGLIGLLDPVVTKPAWTTVIFDHPGMGQAMKGLFENYWWRATAITGKPGATR